MKRVRIGDIVEIETKKGLAYAIYTHKHATPPYYGALIQVFDKLYDSPPADMTEVASNPIRFAVFFPVGPAVNRNLVEVFGRVPIPERLKPWPIFRNGHIDPRTQKVPEWWLKNLETKQSWYVGVLTPEQRKLPILELWNDTLLKERIEEGWRPETDFESLP
jgi:hypothetical protein